MKKISISGQITILFSFVLILSAVLFTTVTLNRIKYVAEQETYSRLITYSTLLESHSQDPQIEFKDMQIGFAKIRNKNLVFSADLSQYMSEAEFKKIVEDAYKQTTPPIIKRKMI
ncbi:MAG: hypothetical protein K2N65_05585, partial [Anaeroplasmataceae bacterium]|nr:hypothetical protein [Anaeroplasmataceae bacterium]